jgi:release factor glutamine methyltransferase
LTTIAAALDVAEKRLTSSLSPRLDAELLLCSLLGIDRARLHCTDATPLDPLVLQSYSDLVAQREFGTPIAYLVGYREFWSIKLLVNQNTLIPRPETEHLVEQGLELIGADRLTSVLDLGTGAGAIAVALASEHPHCRLVATDIDAQALAVGMANAHRLGLSNIEFRAGNWYAALGHDRQFDLIISNPPYVAAGDPYLRQGDLRFEPPGALVGGNDGLDAFREIVSGAKRHLRSGGWLALEIGHDQRGQVTELLESAGFSSLRFRSDYSGNDRVIAARL